MIHTGVDSEEVSQPVGDRGGENTTKDGTEVDETGHSKEVLIRGREVYA